MKNRVEQSNNTESEPGENLQDLESIARSGKYLDVDALSKTMETGTPQDKKTILAFESLVHKLRERLPNYDTILSDDASGRLVTLVLRKIIDQARNEAGLDPVKTFFLASGRHDSAEIIDKIESFLEDKKDDIKKALLVTEYISTGKSIEKLAKVLEKLEIPFDLAAPSINDLPETYSTLISSRIVYGEHSRIGSNLWSRKDLTGVEKNNSTVSPHPVKINFGSNKMGVAAARRDVNRLVDALIPILNLED